MAPYLQKLQRQLEGISEYGYVASQSVHATYTVASLVQFFWAKLANAAASWIASYRKHSACLQLSLQKDENMHPSWFTQILQGTFQQPLFCIVNVGLIPASKLVKL